MEEKLMRMEQTYPQIRWWIVLTLVLGAFVLCFGGPVAAESEQAGVTILAVRHEGRILVGPEGSAWKDMGPGRSVSIEPHKAAYCSAHDDGPQVFHPFLGEQSARTCVPCRRCDRNRRGLDTDGTRCILADIGPSRRGPILSCLLH